MTDSTLSHTHYVQQAEAVADGFMRAVVALPLPAIHEADLRAHTRLEKEHEKLRRAQRRVEEAAMHATGTTTMLLLKLGADVHSIAETGALPDIDRPGDPTGKQSAILAILAEAEQPLSADEIRDALAQRTGENSSVAAVQNMLSRMCRQSPPPVTRPSRGRFQRAGGDLLPSERGDKNFAARTNVRSRTDERRSTGSD